MAADDPIGQRDRRELADRNARLDQRGEQINRDRVDLDRTLSKKALAALKPPMQSASASVGCSVLMTETDTLAIGGDVLDITPTALEQPG